MKILKTLKTIFHKLIKTRQNKTSLLYFNYIFNPLSAFIIGCKKYALQLFVDK